MILVADFNYNIKCKIHYFLLFHKVVDDIIAIEIWG